MNGYHHGDLPRQLLAHAAAIAAEHGPDAITLRGLARSTGVTHAAPVAHFGTRQGLLTALAVEGFENLNEVLSAHTDDIHEMGVAYVTWALDHGGHYAVMWQPRLLNESSEELKDARERAWTLLSNTAADSVSGDPDDPEAKTDSHAAFALVHGLSSIWLSGALPRPDDPATLARKITRRLTVHGRGRPPAI